MNCRLTGNAVQAASQPASLSNPSRTIFKCNVPPPWTKPHDSHSIHNPSRLLDPTVPLLPQNGHRIRNLPSTIRIPITAPLTASAASRHNPTNRTRSKHG